GKSRLVWELIASHVPAGLRVLHGRSVSYGKAASYLPLVELLKLFFDLGDKDDLTTVRERVTSAVVAIDPALRPSLTALLTLMGIAVDDPQWDFLELPQRREQMAESVKRLFVSESVVRPLLVVFEDLHWIDDETQHFLDAFVEALPTVRVVLL